MTRKTLIQERVKKINNLPDNKLLEVHDFAEFLLSKIDDEIIRLGIQKLSIENQSLVFLTDEEEIYTVKDLKEVYK